MAREINNFTVVESAYGPFVVNRHAVAQAEALFKTGRTHFEPELQKILAIARTLPLKAIMVDAGANIGMVSVPVAHTLQGSNGTVIAFEAQRMLCYAMCGTAALNDLENLHVYNQVLGAATGWVNVPHLDYGVAQDFGTLSLVGRDPAAPGEHVLVAHIDGLDLPRLDFLKIDVEGMELEALKGADETLHAHKPWCWIAYNKAGIDPVKAVFEGLPYRFFRMSERDLLCAPVTRLDVTNIEISAPEI